MTIPLVKKLLLQCELENALREVVKVLPDTSLLQSRFNGAQKQFGIGLLDSEEFSRIKARINFALHEMVYRADPTLPYVYEKDGKYLQLFGENVEDDGTYMRWGDKKDATVFFSKDIPSVTSENLGKKVTVMSKL